MSKYSNYGPQKGGDVYKDGGSFRGGYNGREQRASGQDKPYVKRSGCSMKDSYIHKSGPNAGQSSGTPVIWGWKIAVGGAGLVKFVAVLNHKPETKNPRWLKMVVTVTSPNAAKFLTTGFWDTQKGRLHMPDMELIANPSKDYFGRNYTPKK